MTNEQEREAFEAWWNEHGLGPMDAQREAWLARAALAAKVPAGDDLIDSLLLAVRDSTDWMDARAKVRNLLPPAAPAPESTKVPTMLQGEDPRIEPVRNVVERLCGTRQSAENFARRILAAADSVATPTPAPEAAPAQAQQAAEPATAPSPDAQDAERWRTFIGLPHAIRAEWAANLSLAPVLASWVDSAAKEKKE